MPARNTVWTELSKHQDAILRLGVCALLVISALVVIFGWLASLDKLEIPLLFVGVCVITLGMLLAKGAPTVMLATLIVGYVVVPESYLLKLAHMITGPPTPIGEYTKPYGEEKQAFDVGSIVEREVSEWENTRSEEKETLRDSIGCESRMAVMAAAWFVEFRQRLPWLLHVDGCCRWPVCRLR